MGNRQVGEAVVGQTYERPWGSYTILEVGEKYLVKRIEILPGQKFSLQYHNYRFESWTVVSGTLKVTLDDKTLILDPTGTVQIPIKALHRGECISTEKTVFVEVQFGEQLYEDDIVRLEDVYGRV